MEVEVVRAREISLVLEEAATPQDLTITIAPETSLESQATEVLVVLITLKQDLMTISLIEIPVRDTEEMILSQTEVLVRDTGKMIEDSTTTRRRTCKYNDNITFLRTDANCFDSICTLLS